MSKKSRSNPARFIGLLATVQLWQLLGCGGTDDASTTCALEAQLSGAVQWQSTGAPACVTPFGASSGFSIYFNPLGGDLESLHLEVRDVKETETGTFPASVEITMRDQRKWKTISTGCAVKIASQSFVMEDQFRKQYVAKGTGDCAALAMAQSGASGTVTVAPFSFTATVNY